MACLLPSPDRRRPRVGSPDAHVRAPFANAAWQLALHERSSAPQRRSPEPPRPAGARAVPPSPRARPPRVTKPSPVPAPPPVDGGRWTARLEPRGSKRPLAASCPARPFRPLGTLEAVPLRRSAHHHGTRSRLPPPHPQSIAFNLRAARVARFQAVATPHLEQTHVTFGADEYHRTSRMNSHGARPRAATNMACRNARRPTAVARLPSSSLRDRRAGDGSRRNSRVVVVRPPHKNSHWPPARDACWKAIPVHARQPCKQYARLERRRGAPAPRAPRHGPPILLPIAPSPAGRGANSQGSRVARCPRAARRSPTAARDLTPSRARPCLRPPTCPRTYTRLAHHTRTQPPYAGDRTGHAGPKGSFPKVRDAAAPFPARRRPSARRSHRTRLPIGGCAEAVFAPPSAGWSHTDRRPPPSRASPPRTSAGAT